MNLPKSDYMLQNFVRSSNLESFDSSHGDSQTLSLRLTRSRDSLKNSSSLSGPEARSFYEEIVGRESCKLEKKSGKLDMKGKTVKTLKPSRAKLKKPKCVSQSILKLEECKYNRNKSEFLKAAANNDINKIKQYFLDYGKSLLNVTDHYGWNALMCAAAGGHLDVVKYLISKGVSVLQPTDVAGNSAIDIALKSNNSEVIRTLKASINERPTECDMETKRQIIGESPERDGDDVLEYCEPCEAHYKVNDRRQHLTSVVHLFNTHKNDPPRNPHQLSEDNIGYKIMVKKGWTSDKGLGPAGTGRKNPIPTRLKKDRYGLGAKVKQKEKVTHFGPHDLSAIETKWTHQRAMARNKTNNSRELSKKERVSHSKKACSWEKRLRMYMSSE